MISTTVIMRGSINIAINQYDNILKALVIRRVGYEDRLVYTEKAWFDFLCLTLSPLLRLE